MKKDEIKMMKIIRSLAIAYAILFWSPYPPVEPMGICPNIEGHFAVATFSKRRVNFVPLSQPPGIERTIVVERTSNLYPNISRATYINPKSILRAI